MRLLKKTILFYFIFSAVLLLAAIPVFYYALKAMMVNDIDENLVAAKTRIMPQLLNTLNIDGDSNFNFPGYDVVVQKERAAKSGDTIYTVELSGGGAEILPNRLLASHVVVNKVSYGLRIKTSLVNRLSLIKRIVLLLAVLLAALLLGLGVINRVLTKTIWKPFYITLKQLQEYRVDAHPRLQLAKTPITEFNDLNRAAEQLVERDYLAYASQKEFAENASHEMQSPLAVFQSKLELLMQTKPLNEEQAALITDLANASKRMSRLNKSLVLLTRIDNNLFADKETVHIHDVVEKLLQQYSFQIQQQAIQVTVTGATDITVQASRTLIEVLAGNLLSNAIRHNIQGGKLLIALKEKELVVQNTGRPAALDIERMFQRFQKEGTDPGSLGIGLEIVKKICTLNGYTVQYQFINSMHSFSVKF